jgi:ACS family tartrate transporter-like MFS transporter
MNQTPEPASAPKVPEANTAYSPLPAPTARVRRRLLPFLCLLYIFNILDRSNVGFARLTMLDDLNMSREVFDLGYGIFYFGYLVFEVPANLLLRRFGARRWIARIMITWGLVSCATLAVTGPWSFYAVRILLGVAEAGFFPGIILYLTYWFPARERARAMALFMTAISFAGVLGNPLSGAVMQYLHGLGGLTGWQWLFLIEGVPSVLLGVVVFYSLPDGPEQAPWLTPAERDWLLERLRQEEQRRRRRHGGDLLRALFDGRVWLLICVYFSVAVGSNAAGSYFPELLRQRFPEQDKFGIGLLGALPHVCAIAGMTLIGTHSDRTGERRGHVALAAFVAAAGWALSFFSSSPWLGLVGFCLAQMGMMSMLPPFWALPTAFLSGAAAAGGIALINSVANLGGLLGPSILGQFGLEAMALTLFAGGLLALCLHQEAAPDGSASP